MKYNDYLFNISSEYYSRIENETVDNTDAKTVRLEKELLSILLKKFKEIINDGSIKKNGILKIKFRSRFWSTTDDGYEQIKELVNSGKFDSFANQYCLYLGNVETREDENTNSYYEIIWDYKTYFETLSMHEIEKGLAFKKNKKYNQSEMIKAISAFKNLPVKHQLSVLKSFMSKVKKECELEASELVEAECTRKGHDYSQWKEIKYKTSERNPYLNSRDYIVPEGMEYITVEHTKWERTCARCGYVETVEQEPQELIDERERQNKKAKIKSLEEELKRLKGE